MGIEEKFYLLDHRFRIAAYEKFVFDKKCIFRIKVLLNNQELCVINGGNTTQYFPWERDVLQEDRISVYPFIYVFSSVLYV